MPHILIVDDAREDAELLQEALRSHREDVSVTHVLDGDEALHFVETNGGVNLILLDHYLPKLNSHGVLARLQQSSAGLSCPVVVLTSHISPPQREALLQAGVARVEDKPIDWDGYVAMAGRMMALCGE